MADAIIKAIHRKPSMRNEYATIFSDCGARRVGGMAPMIMHQNKTARSEIHSAPLWEAGLRYAPPSSKLMPRKASVWKRAERSAAPPVSEPDVHAAVDFVGIEVRAAHDAAFHEKLQGVGQVVSQEAEQRVRRTVDASRAG